MDGSVLEMCTSGDCKCKSVPIAGLLALINGKCHKRNISAAVRVVPLYLGLMVTPLIVGEHLLFPRLQF